MELYRDIVNAHARYRLVSIAMPFFAGQFAASFGYKPLEAQLLLVLCGISATISILCGKIWYRIYPLLFALGVLSVFLQSECIAWYESSSSDRFLIDVINTPQRPKPNIVRVSIRIKNIYWRKNDELVEKEDPLKGKKLYCTAPEFPWRNISGVKTDDYFLANLKVLSLSGVRSPFSFESTLRRRGIAAKCRILNVVRVSKVKEQSWYERLMAWLSNYEPYQMEGGLFASLLFGYRNSLSGVLEKHFQYAGLSHLLVFSGAQVTIIFVVLNWFLYFSGSFLTYVLRTYKGTIYSKIASLGVTFFFVLSIGSDKTTVRALIAASVSFAALALQRKNSVAWGILVSSMILSIIWPGCILEPGLQLTFAALFGIWLGLLRRSFIWGFLYTSSATSCVSLFWFEAFSIAGFILNPIVVPIVSFVTTVGGLPSLALALLDFKIGKVLLEWNFIFLSWLEEGIYRVSMLPWSYLQVPAFWARLIGSLGILLLIAEARRLQTPIRHVI